jgi:uncharacterized protein
MVTSVDTFGCLGNTIKVSAGHYVDLLNPDPATIDINSIAAGLSKICRFGGQCPHFYSVAEHCVHATALAISDGLVGDTIRAVFLHDAAEAYIGDMVKPLKVMMPQYADVERRMEASIEKAFNVDFLRWAETIKFFDRAMLKAEKTTMWPNDKEKWAGFSEIEDRDISLRFWRPDQAEWQFLAMAKTLHLIG